MDKLLHDEYDSSTHEVRPPPSRAPGGTPPPPHAPSLLPIFFLTLISGGPHSSKISNKYYENISEIQICTLKG